MLGGVGEAAKKKEVKKRDFYSKQFNLIDKRHEFAPFIIEAQGGVGGTALKLISALLKKKKELNLRSTSRTVRWKEVCGGELLKKIIFECQRQMARTLLDKTTRENHNFSIQAESRMLIEQASQKAIKALKEDDLKIRVSSITDPSPKPMRKMKSTLNKTKDVVSVWSPPKPETKKDISSPTNDLSTMDSQTVENSEPSNIFTSEMRVKPIATTWKILKNQNNANKPWNHGKEGKIRGNNNVIRKKQNKWNEMSGSVSVSESMNHRAPKPLNLKEKNNAKEEVDRIVVMS